MADLQIEICDVKPTSTQKILEKTSFVENETIDDRKEKLENYKQKIVEDNQQKLSTFYNIKEQEKESHEIVQQQRAEQFDEMMKQLEKRKNKKAKKAAKDSDSDGKESTAIDDNYDGFGSSADLFNKTFNKPQENKVLNDTFLGELKVVEVKDSDDEDYF